MKIQRVLAAATVVALLSAPAFAHGFKAGNIEVEHPWSRATAASTSTGVVYMVLNNEGKEPDRLVSATTPAADKVELHTQVSDNGVMRMRPVDTVEIAPGSSTRLKPGALHMMLVGLKQPLKKGKAFPLTLTFEKAGSVTVQVAVQGPGDKEPAHEGMGTL